MRSNSGIALGALSRSEKHPNFLSSYSTLPHVILGFLGFIVGVGGVILVVGGIILVVGGIILVVGGIIKVVGGIIEVVDCVITGVVVGHVASPSRLEGT